MNIDIKVENLGRFKGGTVKVRPLTVLTGENGTGKSFFTKTLYSVFSIVSSYYVVVKNDTDIIIVDNLLGSKNNFIVCRTNEICEKLSTLNTRLCQE